MQDKRDQNLPDGARSPGTPPGGLGNRSRRQRRWGRLRAVVLDVYGTLFHYEREKLLLVFEEIVRTFNLPVDAPTLFEKWQVHESDFRNTRVYLSDDQEWRASGTFLSYQEAWIASFRKAYEDLDIVGGPDAAAVDILLNDLYKRDAYVEVPQALEALRSRVPLALLSNADASFLFKTLEYNNMTFDTVIYSEEERVYKPHPSIFRRVLQRLEIEPHEALYVGDSPLQDVVGAKAVGIPTVWVNRLGDDWPLDEEARPDHEVRDLLGLIDVVTSRSGTFY